MKLILTVGVDNLGAPGDIVEVKDGYGRNYLLPNGFAILWSRGAANQVEDIKRARRAREIRGIDHALEIKEQLEQLEVKLTANASDNGKLFGSATPADIVIAIRKAGGPSIDKRTVQIAKPIKSLGKHKVSVALHPSVTARVAVEVVTA